MMQSACVWQSYGGCLDGCTNIFCSAKKQLDLWAHRGHNCRVQGSAALAARADSPPLDETQPK
eukprot:3889678-Pleurochrysis_carterae.AAC.1